MPLAKTTVKTEEIVNTLTAMGPPTLRPEQVQRVLQGLHHLYDRHGRNQSALARVLKMSQASVNDLLLGKNKPSFRTAEKVAGLMGVQVWTLLGLAAPPTPPTRESHPQLASAVELVAERVPAEVRERVLLAASYLPDLAQSTWIAMLLDPAHGAEPESRSNVVKTREIPVLPKKPA